MSLYVDCPKSHKDSIMQLGTESCLAVFSVIKLTYKAKASLLE